jgi:hypothetical protein
MFIATLKLTFSVLCWLHLLLLDQSLKEVFCSVGIRCIALYFLTGSWKKFFASWELCPKKQRSSYEYEIGHCFYTRTFKKYFCQLKQYWRRAQHFQFILASFATSWPGPERSLYVHWNSTGAAAWKVVPTINMIFWRLLATSWHVRWTWGPTSG